MNILKKKFYSPYIAGACIGLLSAFSYLFTGKFLGSSKSFVSIVAAVETFLIPTHAQNKEYFFSYIPYIDWQVFLVIGILLGSYIASYLGNTGVKNVVPSVWEKRFGKSKGLRYLGAFIGGNIVIVGARLAGGCTSGHGITGGLQLGIAGWLFVIFAFGSAISTALLIYKR